MYYPHKDDDCEIVVLLERSAGNAEVGDMWIETRTFKKTNTLADVLEAFSPPDDYRQEHGGRMIITVAKPKDE